MPDAEALKKRLPKFRNRREDQPDESVEPLFERGTELARGMRDRFMSGVGRRGRQTESEALPGLEVDALEFDWDAEGLNEDEKEKKGRRTYTGVKLRENAGPLLGVGLTLAIGSGLVFIAYKLGQRPMDYPVVESVPKGSGADLTGEVITEPLSLEGMDALVAAFHEKGGIQKAMGWEQLEAELARSPLEFRFASPGNVRVSPTTTENNLITNTPDSRLSYFENAVDGEAVLTEADGYFWLRGKAASHADQLPDFLPAGVTIEDGNIYMAIAQRLGHRETEGAYQVNLVPKVSPDTDAKTFDDVIMAGTVVTPSKGSEKMVINDSQIWVPIEFEGQLAWIAPYKIFAKPN